MVGYGQPLQPLKNAGPGEEFGAGAWCLTFKMGLGDRYLSALTSQVSGPVSGAAL